MTVTPEMIFDAVVQPFRAPVIENVWLGSWVECMVALALPEWRRAVSWTGWDLEHISSGKKIEVKTAAARQVWDREAVKQRPISFDIAARKYYWDGTDAGLVTLEGGPRRVADIYILACHPIPGLSADHRNPAQWEFYVVPSDALPRDKKQISLSNVRKLTDPVGIEGLAASVHKVLF
jgi:hypothetical protein